jgi:hypothetical protein
MFDPAAWAKRLTLLVPELKEVGGAAELNAAITRSEQEESWAFPSPSAYILPLRESAISTNSNTTLCTIQTVRAEIGILLALNTVSVYGQRQAAGHEAIIQIQPLKKRVQECLLGWEAVPGSPVRYVGGQVQNFSAGLLFWTERYEMIYQLRKGATPSNVGGGGVPAGIQPPESPELGDLWVDTTQTPPLLRVYDNSQWVSVDTDTDTDTIIPAQPTPPTDAVLGNLWVDTSYPVPLLKVYAEDTWHSVDTDTDTIISAQETPPTDASEGTLWVDTSYSPPLLSVFDGADWHAVDTDTQTPAGTSSPDSPAEGALWVDTSSGDKPMLKVFDGAAWVSVDTDTDTDTIIPTQDSPPTGTSTGMLWVDTSNTPPTLKVHDGGAWINVDTNTQTPSGPDAPDNPVAGDLWVNTSLNPPIPFLQVYDGSSWISVDNDTVFQWEGTVWGYWRGTQAEYDAIGIKDSNRLYVIVG